VREIGGTCTCDPCSGADLMRDEVWVVSHASNCTVYLLRDKYQFAIAARVWNGVI
jgi:hypothetical protein